MTDPSTDAVNATMNEMNSQYRDKFVHQLQINRDLKQKLEQLQLRVERQGKITAVYTLAKERDVPNVEETMTTANVDSNRGTVSNMDIQNIDTHTIEQELLRRVLVTKTALFAAYNFLITSKNIPTMVSTADPLRSFDVSLQRQINLLRYHPSIVHARELAAFPGFEGGGLVRVEGSGTRGRKKTKDDLLGEFEPTVKTMKTITPSQWFMDFLSVYEHRYGSQNNNLSNMYTGRSADALPAPFLFENIFYLQEDGYKMSYHVSPKGERKGTKSNNLSSFRVYALDINNIVTHFCSDLFGTIDFVPMDKMESDLRLMTKTSFTDLQLFVEFAVLLQGDSCVFSDFLLYPAMYVTEQKQFLVEAMNSAVEFITESARGLFFRTDCAGKIELCVLREDSGSDTNHYNTDAYMRTKVPDRVVSNLTPVLLPNVLTFNKTISNDTMQDTVKDDNYLHIISVLSRILNFDKDAVIDFEHVVKEMKKTSHSTDVSYIDMRKHDRLGMLHTFHKVYFWLVSTALTIKNCKGKDIHRSVDSTFFVERGMWPLPTQTGSDVLSSSDPPDRTSPVVYNSTMSIVPGLMFCTVLFSGEKVTEDKVDMNTPEFFIQGNDRDKNIGEDGGGENPLVEGETWIGRRQRFNKAGSMESGTSTGGLPLGDRLRSRHSVPVNMYAGGDLRFQSHHMPQSLPLREDRRIFFHLFKSFAEIVPGIGRGALERRQTRDSDGQLPPLSDLSKVDPITRVEGPRKVDKDDIKVLTTNMATRIRTVKASYTNILLNRECTGPGTFAAGRTISYMKNIGPFTGEGERMVSKHIDTNALYSDKHRGHVNVYSLPVTYTYNEIQYVGSEEEKQIKRRWAARGMRETFTEALAREESERKEKLRQTYIPLN